MALQRAPSLQSHRGGGLGLLRNENLVALVQSKPRDSRCVANPTLPSAKQPLGRLLFFPTRREERNRKRTATKGKGNGKERERNEQQRAQN
jgi:hypothetical protein